MSFESSLKTLEEMSVKIRNSDTTLDDALKCYEEGIKAYKDCTDILNSAKQKIEVIEK